MNIKQAKEHIKRAMRAYFAKDAYGNYRLSTSTQRPIFLLGAPGLGKTAIMEQIAQELEVGFVSYSMTHHTRQSALGLPFIEKRTFGEEQYDVSEYTMSEIIASVYEEMELSGKSEGILFLDEINCVSETLNPAMLQFLQYKVFGRHRVPDGWIVVTAGNPSEYNRTARDFDIATWDRLRRIDVEPDFDVWREFALAQGVHPAVVSYLDIERDHFYHIETTIDGASFVTARGWDDLSRMMSMYEELGLPVDGELVSQYVQDAEIAQHFFVYYELFNKYRSDYAIDEILAGQVREEIIARAQAAAFDERVALMGLLVDALCTQVRDIMMRSRGFGFMQERLRGVRDVFNGTVVVAGVGLAAEVDTGARAAGEVAARNASAGKTSLAEAVERDFAEITRRMTDEKRAGLLTTQKYESYEMLRTFYQGLLADGVLAEGSFEVIEERFGELLDGFDVQLNQTDEAMSSVFEFVERAFGSGQEMLLLVSDLSVNADTMNYINEYGCDAYFAHTKDVLFDQRGDDLHERIRAITFEDE